MNSYVEKESHGLNPRDTLRIFPANKKIIKLVTYETNIDDDGEPCAMQVRSPPSSSQLKSANTT